MPGDPFYQSPEWRAFRKAYLRDHPTCQVLGCGKKAGHLDHIIARARGGAPLDRSNVQGLCHSHHSSKTAQADGGFGNRRKDAPSLTVPGCAADGRPLDPTHPWNRRG